MRNNSDSEESMDSDSSTDTSYTYTCLSSESNSSDDSSQINVVSDENFYKSKDGTQIYSPNSPNPQVRSMLANIFKKKPGFTSRCLRNCSSAVDAFNMFIDDDMKKQILNGSNSYIYSSCKQIKEIKMHELDNFIGAVLLIGLLKGKIGLRREYWSEEYGIKALKDSMTITRFEEISRVLRFDIRSERNQRDPIGPIQIVFQKFIENCKSNYIPSHQMTVDEQLVTFKGRCRFRMFIPSKPGRYGIKIWALCDSTNAYLYNADIYTGKNGNSREKNQGENVVKRLAIPIYKSGRNLTTDNFFTSFNLAKFLLDNNLTLVGTVRKNKAFLPIDFQSSKGASGSIKFLFQNRITLVKYNQKKNKSVVLLSSQHHQPEINENSGKPEIVHYYNQTKGGVDTLDQIIRYYSCKRATRRWPLAIFYNVLDTAAYNSFLLYLEKNPSFQVAFGNQSRREFIKILSAGLLMAGKQCDEPIAKLKKESDSNIRGRCEYCSGTRKKSRINCYLCQKFVCDEHRVTLIGCKNCLK